MCGGWWNIRITYVLSRSVVALAKGLEVKLKELK